MLKCSPGQLIARDLEGKHRHVDNVVKLLLFVQKSKKVFTREK